MADSEKMSLEAVTAFMQQNQLTRVRMGGLEVEMSPQAFPTAALDQASISKAEESIPTDDEFLFWSAPNAWMEKEDVVTANG